MIVIHTKVLHLKMGKFFKETFLKITPYLLICMGVGIALERYNPIDHSILRFAINVIIFMMVVFLTMIFGCMNTEEKQACRKLLGKFTKRKGKSL